MKVILIRDVARIGRRYEIKEVPSGHALNFLIPRKLAEAATPENLRRLESLKSKQAKQGEKETQNFSDVVKKLETESIVLTVEANAQGHLFKGIKADDIVRALGLQGMTVESHVVLLEEPIKALGTYKIVLQSGEQKGRLTLSVVAQ